MTDLVYILAASHSGSTLLAMLLSTHPEICTVGELKATNLGDPQRYRCSCGAWITACPFWSKVAAAMGDRGERFDVTDARTDHRWGVSPYAGRLLAPLHRGPWLEGCRDAGLWMSKLWRRNFPIIQRRNAALAEVVCGLSGARLIVDSSKTGLRLKHLLANRKLNVKVIRLIRDGRGVALAYMRPDLYADAAREELRDGGAGGDRAGERVSMAAAAHQWRRSNEEAEQALRRVAPDQWVQVRYETLCVDPESTLRRLMEFLGLDAARAAPVKRLRSTAHHVVGNGMRLDGRIDVALDERWRDALTTDERVAFGAKAGCMNRRYGYM